MAEAGTAALAGHSPRVDAPPLRGRARRVADAGDGPAGTEKAIRRRCEPPSVADGDGRIHNIGMTFLYHSHIIISAATSDPPNPFCNSIFLVRPRALCRRAIIDFDASGRLASRDAAQIVPQPHPTSWPSCPVEIAALAALYLLPRSSWSSRQPPNVNECPRRAPRGQTRAHGTQSICRHRGNREAHRRRARTARESNCAAPALDQPSAAVASRGGPADCACADSRGCLTRDGCAIHRHANLDAHLLLRAAEPKNR